MSQVSVMELRRQMVGILRTTMDDTAEAAARALICDAWRWSLTELALKQQESVEAQEAERLISMAERMAQHEPLQYVTGHCDFCGIEIATMRGALIPRPETEQLVDAVCEWASGREGLRVLDIGTGSGCIAVAVSERLECAKVVGIDVKDEALAVARHNAEGRGVELRKADILAVGASELGTFDIVASNPPYVMESEKSAMERNVLDYEPGSALFVPDDDPLVFYRRITELCLRGLLARGGGLFFEINEALGSEMKSLMEAAGFRDVAIKKDYLGKDRMAVGTLQ